jgi:hypothetical protein
MSQGEWPRIVTTTAQGPERISLASGRIASQRSRRQIPRLSAVAAPWTSPKGASWARREPAASSEALLVDVAAVGRQEPRAELQEHPEERPRALPASSGLRSRCAVVVARSRQHPRSTGIYWSSASDNTATHRVRQSCRCHSRPGRGPRRGFGAPPLVRQRERPVLVAQLRDDSAAAQLLPSSPSPECPRTWPPSFGPHVAVGRREVTTETVRTTR